MLNCELCGEKRLYAPKACHNFIEHGKQEIKQRTKQKNSVDGFHAIHAINKTRHPQWKS